MTRNLPIISASCEAKSAMSMSRLASPIRPRPRARPSSAVAIGRPIAVSEPKLMSRMTTAAAMPTTVAKPIEACCACWTASPPSSTCKAGERAVCAVATTFSTAVFGRAPARWSKVTVAKPTVPPDEIARRPGP